MGLTSGTSSAHERQLQSAGDHADGLGRQHEQPEQAGTATQTHARGCQTREA